MKNSAGLEETETRKERKMISQQKLSMRIKYSQFFLVPELIKTQFFETQALGFVASFLDYLH